MRALVIGRGSMGRRRIRDLTALGVEVSSWDVTDGGMLTKDLFSGRSVVVSTPPSTKQVYADMASYNLSYCFTEADVSLIKPFTDGINRRLSSATPLFCEDVLRVMGEQVGRVAAYTYHLGQNLKDWHPGVDLRTYYAAQRETGACREMVPFELIWLTKWQGPVRRAYAVRGHRAKIADIDDVYQVVLEHESGALGHVLIEVLSRPAIRRITIVGTRGTIERDISYTEADYLAEMRGFIAAVKGETPWPYSQAEEAANIEVLHMIERTGS